MNSKKIIFRVAVGVVIIKDDKALIIQRNSDESIYPGLWELPSGKRETGETTEQALVRETAEETGLTLTTWQLCSIFDYQTEKENEIKDTTQINYIGKISASDEIKLSNEHQDYQWIKKTEINNYNISDSTKDTLEKAFLMESN